MVEIGCMESSVGLGNSLVNRILDQQSKDKSWEVPGYLGIIEGICTAWIPGFLMLLNCWPN